MTNGVTNVTKNITKFKNTVSNLNSYSKSPSKILSYE